MSRRTQEQSKAHLDSRTGLSPSLAGLSRRLLLSIRVPYRLPYNPTKAEALLVWAIPRSLTTTDGVSFDLLS